MFDQEGGNSNQFVCPNDRQLALRAKLKTGWSMKTASLELRPFPQRSNSLPLQEDEQATIIEVIKKAEELDILEQKRIGKLMDRLEQLRRSALGRGPNQCLLCGEKFRLLIGTNKIICSDCGKSACRKCAVEIVSYHNSRETTTWLCLICSETREIWKKSGAWFFKGFPKYILPGSSTRQAAVAPPALAFGSTRKKWNRPFRHKDSTMDESSSEDDSKISWSRFYQSNNFSNDANESSRSHSRDFQLKRTGNYVPVNRQTSSGESQSSKDTNSTCASYNNECTRCTGTSCQTLTAARTWDDLANSSEQNEKKSAIDTSLATVTYTSNGRRDSMASHRSTSDMSWNEEKISTCCAKKTIEDPISSTSKRCDSSSAGSMEFSLTYDPIKLTLHCVIYRAKNLLPMDINGLADPFCKIDILPTTKTSTRLKTKTVHKTRNPEYNENITFYDITEDDLTNKTIHIMVMDDDKFGHDYMGETKVPLAKLRVQNTIYLTQPLELLRPEPKGPLPPPDLTQWFDDLWSRGQILLCLCYNTKRRALLVTVVKCANLLPMDNNGYSDPFVKLYLRPDQGNHARKHKTSIKWKNLNPVFNEEFAFETRPTELSTQSLHLTVWDKDYGKSNDYLGGLVVGGLGSKGRRLKHWLDVIRYPDHRHEYWHNLTDEPIGD